MDIELAGKSQDALEIIISVFVPTFVALVSLAVLALAGLALASRASYLLLTRSRGIVAVLLILLFCMPAWLLSVFYLHGVLVFLAWV